MSQIPAAFIEELVCRIDLASLVSERVQLKKSSSTYKGCCPFHDEKTPSFFVYNEDQPPRYHCFGCGAHGNAIDFVRTLEHLSFTDSVELLSKRAGLEVPRAPSAQRFEDRLKPLYRALSLAQQKFQQALQQQSQAASARDYLQQRKISQEMIELYGLGFAPGGRNFLTNRATKEQLRAYTDLKLIYEKGEYKADLFHNRLMFPIRDSRGRTVAFAGRTLIGDQRKYINSSESPVFHKSFLLYGLWEARKQSRKLDQLIIVEGYLDVIALAQFGICNAVAAMGTATNEKSLSNILAVSCDVLFCFDGDRAGTAAAKKAMTNILPLLEDGHKVSFLILPDGDDPDTLVRKEGAERFRERIAAAIPLSEYFFQVLGSDLNLRIPEDKGILSNRCKAALQTIKARVIKDGLYQRLRELTRSSTWTKANSYKKGGLRKSESLVTEDPVPVPNRTVARVCLGLYCKPSWSHHVRQILDYEISQQDETALPIFLQWIIDANISARDDLLYALATDSRLRKKFGHLFNAIEHVFAGQQIQKEAEDMFNIVKEKYLSIDFERIEKAIIADPKNLEIQEKYRAVTRELSNIRG